MLWEQTAVAGDKNSAYIFNAVSVNGRFSLLLFLPVFSDALI